MHILGMLEKKYLPHSQHDIWEEDSQPAQYSLQTHLKN